MTILKIEDYNYSIVYIEHKKKSSVYKRLVDGKWLQLKGTTWTVVESVEQLEVLFKQKRDEKEDANSR